MVTQTAIRQSQDETSPKRSGVDPRALFQKRSSISPKTNCYRRQGRLGYKVGATQELLLRRQREYYRARTLLHRLKIETIGKSDEIASRAGLDYSDDNLERCKIATTGAPADSAPARRGDPAVLLPPSRNTPDRGAQRRDRPSECDGVAIAVDRKSTANRQIATRLRVDHPGADPDGRDRNVLFYRNVSCSSRPAAAAAWPNR